MRLTHIDYGIELKFDENVVNVLVIENPSALITLTGDLWYQTRGQDGGWILSDNTREFDISKSLECSFNPFAIDINNKKILNAVYKELLLSSKDELFIATSELNTIIANYLNQLISNSTVALEYDYNLNIPGLLKLYNVKPCNCIDDLPEAIVEYIQAMHKIVGINSFAFINFKQYFNNSELIAIYESCLYEKVNLLMIESSDKPVTDFERKVIIDSDGCIIKL